jgi:putative ABC transport system permease protein
MSTGAMPFREAIRLAVDALRAHKLRTFLTLLGVIFGVMTVVAVAAVIEGLNVYVGKTMEEEFGANTIILDRYGIVTSLDEWLQVQKNKIITLEDYRDLRARASLAREMGIRLDASLPYLRQGGSELTNVSVIGYSPSIPAMGAGNINVEEGRFITESDDENRANVVFVGYKVREKLFGGANPVGRELRIQGEPFRIIGVSKELGSFLGNERDTLWSSRRPCICGCSGPGNPWPSCSSPGPASRSKPWKTRFAASCGRVTTCAPTRKTTLPSLALMPSRTCGAA